MVDASKTSLTKPEVYETQRIRLTSPILHIGSEVSRLSPFEYVVFGNRVYLPNQEALAKALKERGRLEDYIRIIEDRKDITSLLKHTFGDRWQTASDTSGEPIFPESTSSLKWTNQGITNLRPMIRNGFGQLYIPGSSIKGAIRTAIAYYLLKPDRYQVPNQQRSEIEEKLSQTIKSIKWTNEQKRQKNEKLLSLSKKQEMLSGSEYTKHLFSDFELNYQGQPIKRRSISAPNTDFMRAVQVTDSEPLIEDKLPNKQGNPVFINRSVTAEVVISSHFQDGKAKKYKAPVYAEMVRNVKTQFTISLDFEMLSWFHRSQGVQIPFKTVSDILKICHKFAQDQWDYEHDYWLDIKNNPHAQGQSLDFNNIRKFYEPEKCPYNLRVGWASGMTGTTIDLLLDDLRAEIRDACGCEAPEFEAPKSRRTVVGPSGGIKYTPGWVKFEVL